MGSRIFRSENGFPSFILTSAVGGTAVGLAGVGVAKLLAAFAWTELAAVADKVGLFAVGVLAGVVSGLLQSLAKRKSAETSHAESDQVRRSVVGIYAPPSGELRRVGVSVSAMDPSIAVLLAYLFWPLAVVWLVIEPYNKDRFVRFHAFQALAFFVACFVLSIGLTILSVVLVFIPYVGAVIAMLLWPVFGLALFVAWLLLMYKGYNKEMWKLPVIGEFCAKQAG